MINRYDNQINFKFETLITKVIKEEEKKLVIEVKANGRIRIKSVDMYIG